MYIKTVSGNCKNQQFQYFSTVHQGDCCGEEAAPVLFSPGLEDSEAPARRNMRSEKSLDSYMHSTLS